MTKKRKTISKRLRFEVFKRDSFRCQYCGSSAPDVLLHVDHIKPVSSGGTDDIINLITSCQPCNLGKSDKRLNDLSAVSKAKKQLDALQERREQLELMFQWQQGLTQIADDALDRTCSLFESLVEGVKLETAGRQIIRKAIDKFPEAEVCAAIRAAVSTYVRDSTDGVSNSNQVDMALQKIAAICHINRTCAERPHMRRVYHLKNILAKRVSYMDSRVALALIERAVLDEANDIELLETVTVSSWTKFKNKITDLILFLETEG